MRFLLSTGAVVIGTRLREEPDSIQVLTPTGVTVVLKSQIVSMDYRVEAGHRFDLGAGSVPIARPAAPVPEPPAVLRRERNPGRATTVAGSIIFGLGYGISCLGAMVTLAGTSDTGLLLAVPVVGPAIWGFVGDNEPAVGIVLSGMQAVGAALVIHGIVRTSAWNRERQGRAAGLVPLLTAEVQGLVAWGQF